MHTIILMPMTGGYQIATSSAASWIIQKARLLCRQASFHEYKDVVLVIIDFSSSDK